MRRHESRSNTRVGRQSRFCAHIAPWAHTAVLPSGHPTGGTTARSAPDCRWPRLLDGTAAFAEIRTDRRRARPRDEIADRDEQAALPWASDAAVTWHHYPPETSLEQAPAHRRETTRPDRDTRAEATTMSVTNATDLDRGKPSADASRTSLAVEPDDEVLEGVHTCCRPHGACFRSVSFRDE